MTIRIAINGFGRIGRLAARQIVSDPVFELLAINDLAPPETLAYLFQNDSTQGAFETPVSLEDGHLVVGGKRIALTQNRDISANAWGEKGVDLVLECTGVFRDRTSNQAHFEAGAKKVIISAPASDPDITMVLGVNEESYDPNKHHLISNASCTTNCVSPPIKALDDAFGVSHAVLNTVHAYTSTQAILDTPKKGLRLSRAAAVNLIPSTTGAAKAVGEVIPHLKGKLHGLAIRVPTPTGSITDITLTLNKDASLDDIHGVLKAYAEKHPSVLKVSEGELVSSDIVGSHYSSIVDAPMSMKVGPLVKILAWYDNEAGYATRLVDMARYVGEKL